MNNKERIIKSYQELDRSYFMEEYKECANMNVPFPIGHGQTISQPSLVLEMTLLLDPHEDSKVLELGTGSGFQTALLAKCSKIVYTVERIKDLHLKAKARLGKAGYENIEFKLDDGNLGWEEYAPYDRIMVTAAAHRLPEELIEQLAPGGKMLIPVGPGLVQELLVVTKTADGAIDKQVKGEVSFVPLIGQY